MAMAAGDAGAADAVEAAVAAEPRKAPCLGMVPQKRGRKRGLSRS